MQKHLTNETSRITKLLPPSRIAKNTHTINHSTSIEQSSPPSIQNTLPLKTNPNTLPSGKKKQKVAFHRPYKKLLSHSRSSTTHLSIDHPTSIKQCPPPPPTPECTLLNPNTVTASENKHEMRFPHTLMQAPNPVSSNLPDGSLLGSYVHQA